MYIKWSTIQQSKLRGTKIDNLKKNTKSDRKEKKYQKEETKQMRPN